MGAADDRYVAQRRAKHARARAQLAARIKRLRQLTVSLALDAGDLVSIAPFSELDDAVAARRLTRAVESAAETLDAYLNPTTNAGTAGGKK